MLFGSFGSRRNLIREAYKEIGCLKGFFPGKGQKQLKY